MAQVLRIDSAAVSSCAMRRCSTQPPTQPPTTNTNTVERFLSSLQDYEQSIPGLHFLHRPPAAADADAEDAAAPQQQQDARAALLRALAASPAAAPPLADGCALIRRVHAQQLLPIGCDAIDELFSLGLREGMVFEVVGETSAGKTQICLAAAAVRALHGERVLYVDTTNGFSAARVARLCRVQRAVLAAEGGGEVGWVLVGGWGVEDWRWRLDCCVACRHAAHS